MTDPDYNALETYFYAETGDRAYTIARVAWRKFRHRATTATRLARASSPAIVSAAAELEQAGAAARKAGEHASRGLAALGAAVLPPHCATCSGTGAHPFLEYTTCETCNGRG